MLGSPSGSPPDAHLLPMAETLGLALWPPLAAWLPLLPGIALWALALYLPLSLPLRVLEERLGAAGWGRTSRGCCWC